MTIITVIFGATRIVTRSLKKNLQAIQGNTSNRLFTKDGYTWNVTHTTENTRVILET